MRISTTPSIVAFFLCASLLLPGASQAYLLRVDFTVDTAPSNQWNGYFTFDNSIMPVGGGTVLSPTISSLSFLYDGITWDLSNAYVGSIQFEADGSVHDWTIEDFFHDPNYLGPQIDILGFLFGQGGEFTFWNNGGSIAVYGELEPWTVTKVPEPGALMLLGLAPLLLIRRRKV